MRSARKTVVPRGNLFARCALTRTHAHARTGTRTRAHAQAHVHADSHRHTHTRMRKHTRTRIRGDDCGCEGRACLLKRRTFSSGHRQAQPLQVRQCSTLRQHCRASSMHHAACETCSIQHAAHNMHAACTLNVACRLLQLHTAWHARMSYVASQVHAASGFSAACYVHAVCYSLRTPVARQASSPSRFVPHAQSQACEKPGMLHVAYCTLQVACCMSQRIYCMLCAMWCTLRVAYYVSCYVPHANTLHVMVACCML